MTLLGFAWFLAPLTAFDAPLLFKLGIPVGSVWGAVFVHMLVSFPSGRWATRGQRRVVLAGYVLFGMGCVPALLCLESDAIVGCEGRCPRNVVPGLAGRRCRRRPARRRRRAPPRCSCSC